MNGQLIAEYTAGTTYFVHKDHLGSTRLMTKVDGTVYDSMDYLPFGEQIAGGTGTSHKFTGKERDAETASTSGGTDGLDNSQARYLGSRFGRFLSPDPENAGASPTNPQSWNMYAYVLNNPLILIDPTGMECVWDDRSYDANDDKDSGSSDKCSSLGGTWVDHSFFTNTTNNGIPWSSWSPNANSNLTCGGITAPAAPSGQSYTGNMLKDSTQNMSFAGFLRAVAPGGPQDFKNIPAYRSQMSYQDLAAAGNFNYGAAAAARNWTLTQTQQGAGAAAIATSFFTVAGAQIANVGINQANADTAFMRPPMPLIPTNGTAGPGNPFSPVRVNGLLTFGDQTQANENPQVVNGWLWGTLGCSQ
jgi:RHS repeat-associated protein